MIEASRIGIHHCADVSGNLVIIAVNRFANAEQMPDIINCSTVAAEQSASPTASHCHNLLQHAKVIFGMRISKAVSGVSVGFAIDMRYAESITDDFDVIGALCRCSLL